MIKHRTFPASEGIFSRQGHGNGASAVPPRDRLRERMARLAPRPDEVVPPEDPRFRDFCESLLATVERDLAELSRTRRQPARGEAGSR